MNISFKHFPRYCLALALVMILGTFMVACAQAPTLSSIAVTPASPANLVVGLGITPQFTATGTYSDGSKVNISAAVTWASSDTKVATISSGGFATGVAAGNTNITASLSGITGPAVALKVLTLSSIAITPASPSNLVAGATQQFAATGTYSDGSTADISSQATWVSSSYRATVTSTGLANLRAGGSTDITVSFLGVTSPPDTLTMTVKLSSITITPGASPDLPLGSSQFFTATGSYSDGSTTVISSQVTWASSDTGVANLVSPGIFSGVAVGTTNITASLEGVTSQVVPLKVVAAS